MNLTFQDGTFDTYNGFGYTVDCEDGDIGTIRFSHYEQSWIFCPCTQTLLVDDLMEITKKINELNKS